MFDYILSKDTPTNLQDATALLITVNFVTLTHVTRYYSMLSIILYTKRLSNQVDLEVRIFLDISHCVKEKNSYKIMILL